jgi:hypothetical protein
MSEAAHDLRLVASHKHRKQTSTTIELHRLRFGVMHLPSVGEAVGLEVD